MRWSRLKQVSFVVAVLLLAGLALGRSHYVRSRRVSVRDFSSFFVEGRPVGVLAANGLAPLHVNPADLRAGTESGGIRYLGPTEYLNHMRAVVTHTVDDSSELLPNAIDAMDKYGVKTTIFVSTEVPPISNLWPRLEAAIGNGHEIGSHSRSHACRCGELRLLGSNRSPPCTDKILGTP